MCVFPKFCEPLWKINSNWGGSHGDLQSVATSDESCGYLGTCYLQLESQVGRQSRGTEPFTCGMGYSLEVARVRTELHCRTPGWYYGELLDMGGGGNPTHLVMRSVRSEVFYMRSKDTWWGEKWVFHYSLKPSPYPSFLTLEKWICRPTECNNTEPEFLKICGIFKV